MLRAASRAHDRLASATGIGLRELEAFVMVAELGSFSAAARRLNLSQPAVTARIQKLEERLGTRLLVRTTRSIEATDTGRRLAEQAALTLRELNTLLLELMAEGARDRPRVVVATTFMVAATILPRLIRRHAEREPDTEVVLRDLHQAAAIDSVQRGESDL